MGKVVEVQRYTHGFAVNNAFYDGKCHSCGTVIYALIWQGTWAAGSWLKADNRRNG